MLLMMWAGYRLYPYAPTIDLHKYWHTVQPILVSPSLPPGDFVHFTIVWTFIASLLCTIYGMRGWRLLFPWLAGAEFLARIVVVSTNLKLTDIAGAAAGFATWLLLCRLPGRFSILSAAFFALIVILRLAPFDFEPPGRPFGWLPFYSMMYGSIGVAIQALCEKSYLYGGLIWLWCRAGMTLSLATALTALLLFVTSYAETCLPGRSAEITDAVLALAIGGVFHGLPGEVFARRRLPANSRSPACQTGIDWPQAERRNAGAAERPVTPAAREP
jgi:hypothetical protein